jgi:hypothetical protein
VQNLITGGGLESVTESKAEPIEDIRRIVKRWEELGRSGAGGVLNNIRYTAAHEQGRGLTVEWLPKLGCITIASRGIALKLKV